METKEFDCVEMQRNIRAEFWKEAEEDINVLEKVIDNELEKSNLLKLLMNKIKEQNESLVLS